MTPTHRNRLDMHGASVVDRPTKNSSALWSSSSQKIHGLDGIFVCRNGWINRKCGELWT